MQQQYYINVPWNENLRNCSFDNQELMTLGELLTSGSLPTDSNKYQLNCIINWLGNGLYQNTGTVVSPTWSALGGGGINTTIPGIVFDFPVFTGSGLNDIRIDSAFTGTIPCIYTIVIDSTGPTDTFSWSCSTGGGATMVPITGSNQPLNNGVGIAFDSTTGHTLLDQWVYTAIQVQMSFDAGNFGNNTLIGMLYIDPTNNVNGVSAFGNINSTPVGGIWGLTSFGGPLQASMNALYDGTDLSLGLHVNNGVSGYKLTLDTIVGMTYGFGSGNYIFPNNNAIGNLHNDGSGNLSWVPGGGGGSPALPLTSVQFNKSGVFGGSSDFTWDDTNKNLFVGDAAGGAYLSIQNHPGFPETIFQTETFAIEQNGTGNLALSMTLSGSNPKIYMGAFGWGNNTVIELADFDQQISIRANDSVIIQDSSSQTSASFVSGVNPTVDLGDFGGIGNKNRMTINDGSQYIQFDASQFFNVVDTNVAPATWFSVNTLVGSHTIAMGDITGAYNNNLFTVNDFQNTIIGKTDTLLINDKFGNSWFVVETISNYAVNMGDIDGIQNKTTFLVSDANEQIVGATNTFYLQNPANGTQRYFQGIWNAGHPQINFGSAGGVGNQTNFYLDDATQIINSQTSGSIEFTNPGGDISLAVSPAVWSVAMGNVSGGGHGTKFVLDDLTQQFEFFGFGSISSDRIAFFDNLNRVVKLGDVDADFSGTLVTVDDGNQLVQVNAYHVRFPGLQNFANNAAALAGGLVLGDAYLVTDVTTGSYQIQIVQ